uniref:Uncharacterized protein n=1 Tax=Moniliophthora roreri TaxID=221103 RepID=A0A0W0F6B2_MONRR
MGDMGDIHKQMEPEASGKPTRGQSYEPKLPKPGKPLYYDDPALVLKVDGHAVMVLFISRIHAIDMPQSQPTKEEFPQCLAFNPLIQSQRPKGINMAWDPTQYGKKHRRLIIYPDGGFQYRMRMQIIDKSIIKPLGQLLNSREGHILLKCSHPAVSGNFPLIEDWRFDIGKMVTAPTGQQGVVISHSPAGPTIQCYKPPPNNCDPDFQDLLTIHGYSVTFFDNNIVLIKHMDNNVDHDFSGHANSFRLTPRHKKSQGYSIRRNPESFHQTPWMEAAVRGPREITTGQDWQQFQSEWNEKLALRRLLQQVFIMDHVEASAKIKKARTGTIPWKDRHVLIYAKECHNKGDVAWVYDVHICQKTKSGLQITVKSEVIGRQCQCQMYDYEDLVDEQ